MEERISAAEYRRLLDQKKQAATAHAQRTRILRKRLAAAIIQNPALALESAKITLSNKKAPQQQWSRSQWEELLRTKTLEDIANFLVQPPEEFESLMDCHPFGGLAPLIHGS